MCSQVRMPHECRPGPSPTAQDPCLLPRVPMFCACRDDNFPCVCVLFACVCGYMCVCTRAWAHVCVGVCIPVCVGSVGVVVGSICACMRVFVSVWVWVCVGARERACVRASSCLVLFFKRCCRLSVSFPSAGPHAPSSPFVHSIPPAHHSSVPYPLWVAPPPYMGSR